MSRLLRPLAVALAAALLAPALAYARAEAESGYSKEQTYNAALRYLRVDLGYEVTEKNPKAAYLLFQYAPETSDRPTPGAIEIVDAKDTVKVYVRLAKMPRYHEQVLSDGLMRKLKEDYGPPRDPTPEPPEESPDGGAD